MRRLRIIAVGVGVVLVAVLAAAAYRWRAVPRPPLRDVNGDGRVVVLCFGDSITIGSRFGAYPGILRYNFARSIEVINAGKFGETTEGGKQRLQAQLAAYHPDYVIVLEGFNDHCDDPVRTSFNLAVMATTIRANNAVPLVGTIYPPGKAATVWHQLYDCYDNANDTLRRTIKRTPGTFLVDFAAAFEDRQDELTVDGVHPNGAGCRVLAQTAQAALLATQQPGKSR